MSYGSRRYPPAYRDEREDDLECDCYEPHWDLLHPTPAYRLHQDNIRGDGRDANWDDSRGNEDHTKGHTTYEHNSDHPKNIPKNSHNTGPIPKNSLSYNPNSTSCFSWETHRHTYHHHIRSTPS